MVVNVVYSQTSDYDYGINMNNNVVLNCDLLTTSAYRIQLFKT